LDASRLLQAFGGGGNGSGGGDGGEQVKMATPLPAGSGQTVSQLSVSRHHFWLPLLASDGQMEAYMQLGRLLHMVWHAAVASSPSLPSTLSAKMDGESLQYWPISIDAR